jgi:hypothetical protein
MQISDGTISIKELAKIGQCCAIGDVVHLKKMKKR